MDYYKLTKNEIISALTFHQFIDDNNLPTNWILYLQSVKVDPGAATRNVVSKRS